MLDGAAAALGAEETGERTKLDDGRILNARIDVNGGSIMLTDPMPGQGHPAVRLDGIDWHHQIDDAGCWFERAVAVGCEVVMPMALQFCGDRYGLVKDPRRPLEIRLDARLIATRVGRQFARDLPKQGRPP